jgi:DNA-directed RNA polymerase omega subunit
MLINSKKAPESKRLSPASPQSSAKGPNEELWPGIDSSFRLVVLAALRSKQLLHGALPRIEVDPRKRRGTSIALEEVKRGLVPFTVTGEEEKGDGQVKP